MYVTHGPCPKCGSRDNLGTYKDGHQWCFGCGYHVRTERSLGDRVQSVSRNDQTIVQNGLQSIPNDASKHLGYEGLRWIKQYGITDEELQRYNVMWSDDKRQLIFPIYDAEGMLLAWQARNFDPELLSKRKYYTAGRIDEVLYILRMGGHYYHNRLDINSSICLVEDVASAIKLSRYIPAMPLFGSHISTQRLNRLRLIFNRVVVWLDRDKAKNAYKGALMASQMGFATQVVVTELDPKDLSDEIIKKELYEFAI